jgi:prepilin-type N-terminal cleavage/methylation domain-containing protein
MLANKIPKILSPIKTIHRSYSRTGFTLVEMLVVIGIIGLLLVLSAPVWNTLSGSSSITKSSSDIQGILEQARSYAQANNTYTYVGIWEVDVMKAQQGIFTGGTGRVAVGVIASSSGQKLFTNSPGLITSANAVRLSKLAFFDNLHITGDLASSTSGGLARTASEVVITSNTPTTITFQWPLTGTASYPSSLAEVIEFSPQGCARIQTNSTYDPSLNNYLELELVPSHGNTLAPGDIKNSAVIQINGITGAVRLYRP